MASKFKVNFSKDDVKYDDVTIDREAQAGSSNREELIGRINEYTQKLNLMIMGIITCVVLTIIHPVFIFSFFSLIFIYRYNAKNKIEIEYALDEESIQRYNKFLESFIRIRNSKKLWIINNCNTLYTTQERKVNAGAGRLVDKQLLIPLSITNPNKKIGAFKLELNVRTIVLKVHGFALMFLPDMILIKNGKSVTGILYDDLRVLSDIVRFIETGSVPRDSKIVDYTYQYVNKNGSPDKRYKNNRRIPVVQYGALRLSANQLDVELQTSNVDIPTEIKACLEEYSPYVSKIKNLEIEGAEIQ